MGKRHQGGGLDYTPRAFPGARAPDGPAPDLEAKLANLGLADDDESDAAKSEAQTETPRSHRPPVHKSDPLDYTPRPFAGARAPDGPAPDLEERLIRMGLAEGRVSAALPSGKRPRRRLSVAPRPPSDVSRAGSTLLAGKIAARLSARDGGPGNAASLRGVGWGSAATVANSPSPVPPEAAPRPLSPSASNAPAAGSPVQVAGTAPAGLRARVRAGVRSARFHRPEERARMSLRLEPSVDQKLDELASLRGLDRNTAVSVAIAQDWIACFGGSRGGHRS